MSKDKIFLFLTLILVVCLAFALDVPRYFFEQRGQFVTENLQKNTVAKDIGAEKKPIYAKGIYITFRTASNHRMQEIIDLIKRTELNSVVIDIKDYTGRIPFLTESDLIHEYGSEKIFIKDIKELIENLHKEGIYTIARIAVFEDNYLPREKPELALKNQNGGIWHDNKGLVWLDPASQEVWDYTVAIAREAVKVGFDEINLDYIRFPSDGETALIKYPFWNREKTRAEVIRDFFEYFNYRIKPLGVFISADLFGLTLTSTNDLNIGQWLEYAAPYFDYICPMVYPSHYPSGFLGLENPALYPYEVIYNGLVIGAGRLTSVSAAMPGKPIAKLRPWLQDFNIGAYYDARMIELQKKAVYDAGADGWLLWNPKNYYTEAGLETEE